MLNKIIQGDALTELQKLPDQSVDCIVTSPPYYGLRDYGTASWEGGDEGCQHIEKHNLARDVSGGFTGKDKGTRGQQSSATASTIKYRNICKKCGARRIDQQLGLEPTLNEYLDNMLKVTAELKRVLKKTGTLWWNHGDSYGANWRGSGAHNASDKQLSNAGTTRFMGKNFRTNGQKYRAGGDVPNKSLLLQAHRLAIRMIDEQGWILRNQIIWHKPNVMPSSVKDRFTVDYEPILFFTKSKKYWFEPQYEPHQQTSFDRNKYSFNDTHKRKALRATGSANHELTNPLNPVGRNKRTVWKIPTAPFSEAHFAVFPEKLITTPIKAGCPPDGVVLDPFMGSGTVAIVARKLGRNYLGIELNPEYIAIAERRLSQQVLL